MSSREEYLRLMDAAQEYGVSRSKLSLLIRGGTLKAYRDQRDKRARLVKRSELDELFQIRPEKETAGG